MPDAVRAYYDGYGGNEWGRLDAPAGRLEFAINSRFIRDYLPAGARVLDLGGGPGRYAIHLARQGHRVTLADLSPALVELARVKAREAGLDECFDGFDVVDARDLSAYADGAFGAVLALGPFYHLVAEADRARAADEIARALAPAGLAFVAAHTVYGWLNGLIERAATDPRQVPPGTFGQVLSGRTYFNPVPGKFTSGYFYRPRELAEFFAARGFRTLALASSKGFAYGKERELESLRDRDRDAYGEVLELVYRTAGDPDLLANSGQIILVAQKV